MTKINVFFIIVMCLHKKTVTSHVTVFPEFDEKIIPSDNLWLPNQA